MKLYLLLMALAAAATYLATPAVRALACKLGAITPVRDRDVHTQPTPRMGGIAMLVGFAVAMVVASQMPFLDRVFSEFTPWAILVSAGLVSILGVLDDLWDLDWFTKLLGQVLAAGLMAWQGVQLVTFPIFGLTIGSSRLSLIVTVLVVVTVINAVNWVDGLDGLAAGLIAIGGTAFFIYTYMLTRLGSPTDYSNLATVIIAIIVGVCIGFLPHNFHPARIFMGDSGAMLLGLTMAGTAIVVTGQIDPAVIQSRQAFPAFLPLLLPVAVLVLPLVDMVATTVRRIVKGKSPFHADRTHIHHRLLDFGHSHRSVVLIMYSWALVIGFAASALALFPVVRVIPIAALGILFAIIVTVRLPRAAKGKT